MLDVRMGELYSGAALANRPTGTLEAKMFERFTDKSRRVVVIAQNEARRLDHNYIGTEHILLGLVDQVDCVAAQAIENLGVNPEAVRQAVEQKVEPGHHPNSGSGHIPFTPRAKKVLERSLREALGLGHNYIDTEHILLALIWEGGVGAQVLADLADLGQVRAGVVEILSATGKISSPKPRQTSLSYDSPVEVGLTVGVCRRLQLILGPLTSADISQRHPLVILLDSIDQALEAAEMDVIEGEVSFESGAEG